MKGRLRRKLVIAAGIVAALFVLANVIFGFILDAPDDSSEKRCIYSLYRAGVALVEYSNVTGFAETPSSLQVLVDKGIVEPGWLRSSELGPRHKYFGRFSLIGPRPPLVIWSETEYEADILGVPISARYGLNGDLKIARYEKRLLEKHVEEVAEIRGVLACGESDEDIEYLSALAREESESPTRAFAVYKLSLMRRKEFEQIFMNLLEVDDGAVRGEAAHALALFGNPAGGGAILARLRSRDYFTRLRAFGSLQEMAGKDFGFNPVLDSESQLDALAEINEWWAGTVGKSRESENGGEPENSGGRD